MQEFATAAARPTVAVTGSHACASRCAASSASAATTPSTPARWAPATAAAPPFFFTKPADAVMSNGSAVPYPPRTADLHHEIELVVALGWAARSRRART